MSLFRILILTSCLDHSTGYSNFQQRQWIIDPKMASEGKEGFRGQATVRRQRQADEWKKIQQKTFTNWFNDRMRGHLKVAKKKIDDLETDLIDGLLLIDLIEKIASKKVGRYTKKPMNKVQCIENLGTALRFIKEQNIKLVNIGKFGFKFVTCTHYLHAFQRC